eukprot:SAG25_NODE_9356_length_376_cov_0.552347_1_plen_64_part_00
MLRIDDDLNAVLPSNLAEDCEQLTALFSQFLTRPELNICELRCVVALPSNTRSEIFCALIRAA